MTTVPKGKISQHSKRRRKAGAKNYNTDLVLNLVNNFKPTGSETWKTVALK
jgi:hypothetical protein